MKENKHLKFDDGSFRDPIGRIFHFDGRIFRECASKFEKIFLRLEDKGIITESISKGFLVPTWKLKDHDLLRKFNNHKLILEHKKIPFISYPYEWCFDQLKCAALFHLEFQIYLLKKNVVLRDSSAYNIQFIGSNPIFIDISSLTLYEEGSFWLGYKQFCEQFLYPLVLQTKLKIPSNFFLRNNLEGIDSITTNQFLPFYKKMNLNSILHIQMQAMYSKKNTKNNKKYISKIKDNNNLSKSKYFALLSSLHSWIKKLNVPINKNSAWINYSNDNSYSDNELLLKDNLVKDFIKRVKPNSLLDLGCNTGKFIKTAIKLKTEVIIGIDFDETVVRKLFLESKNYDYKILTLVMDLSNPSPSQGWLELERMSFKNRFKTDSLIALALIHHLAITKNIPINQILSWIVDFAPTGLVEFIPSSDQMVRQMTYFRESLHEEYSLNYFENCLSKIANITKKTEVSNSGRTVYEYLRKQ